MKLTSEQRSELISEMASSEAGFNELFRVLLDSFSKQERALFLAEHAGEQANGFRPRRWRGHGWSFQLRIPRTRSNAFRTLPIPLLWQTKILFYKNVFCMETTEKIFSMHAFLASKLNF